MAVNDKAGYLHKQFSKEDVRRIEQALIYHMNSDETRAYLLEREDSKSESDLSMIKTLKHRSSEFAKVLGKINDN